MQTATYRVHNSGKAVRDPNQYWQTAEYDTKVTLTDIPMVSHTARKVSFRCAGKDKVSVDSYSYTEQSTTNDGHTSSETATYQSTDADEGEVVVEFNLEP